MALRQVQPRAVLVVPATEFQLLIAGDYLQMPGSVVIVVPDGASPEDMLAYIRAAGGAVPSPGTGSNPPPGIPI